MKTTILSKLQTSALVTVTLFFSLGFFTPAFAGPERLVDSSKDKVQMLAAPEDPKWFAAIAIGTDFDTGATNFSDGFTQTLATNPTPFFPPTANALVAGINPGQFEKAELRIRERAWDCAYSNFGHLRV